MAVELNHIIVPARDKHVSAAFLARILGLEIGAPMGPFTPVQVSNGVTLDFMNADDFRQQHCAFLVSEEEFDGILARIRDSGVAHYSDPDRSGSGQINHYHGGRGVYFDDPDGHLMEAITQPYGASPS